MERARFFDGEPRAVGKSRPRHVVISLERRYSVVPDFTLRESEVNVHVAVIGSKTEYNLQLDMPITSEMILQSFGWK